MRIIYRDDCRFRDRDGDDDDEGGVGVVLTRVLCSDRLQQTFSRTFTDTVQRHRLFCFRLQQLQLTLSSNSQEPEAATAAAVIVSRLLPGEAANKRTFSYELAFLYSIVLDTQPSIVLTTLHWSHRGPKPRTQIQTEVC